MALLAATEKCLLRFGYAGLSTRKVAEEAGMPLSQIHYHFGSKKKLVLSLLRQQNERLLKRQSNMLTSQLPLWKRWDQACDFLDEDLASGYVRILQELYGASYSDAEIAMELRAMNKGWFELIANYTREAEEKLGGLGPFGTEEITTVIVLIFMGAETNILAGFEQTGLPIRKSLRKIGALIRTLEEKP